MNSADLFCFPVMSDAGDFTDLCADRTFYMKVDLRGDISCVSLCKHGVPLGSAIIKAVY